MGRRTTAEGMHDDCVVALALVAERGRQHVELALALVDPIAQPPDVRGMPAR